MLRVVAKILENVMADWLFVVFKLKKIVRVKYKVSAPRRGDCIN